MNLKKDDFQSEEEFLRNYDSSIFEKPSAAVDTVIFTVFDESLYVLIVKRDRYPFKGCWSLVGGYIDVNLDIDIESTAKRKLKEKTGVTTPYLEQFSTIGNKTRDPRGWSSTTIYFALIPYHKISLKTGNGVLDIKWLKVSDGNVKTKLAFDHNSILNDCIKRLQSKVLYTSLPAHLMPKDFTLGELQKVYEIIINKKIDHKSFRRRILGSNILEEVNEMRQGNKRPAQLYRLKKLSYTHFFLRNIEGAKQ